MGTRGARCIVVWFGLLSIATCAGALERPSAPDKPTAKIWESRAERHHGTTARPRLQAFSKRRQRPGLDPSLYLSRGEVQELATSSWEETQSLAAKGALVANSKRRIFFPTDNGADPSGSSDSTAALQLTINQAFEVASTHSLLTGIIDLGGVEVHLAGGQYLISRPLAMPDVGGGNLLIHGGTIRASSSFPSDGYLIELASSEMKEERERLGGRMAESISSPVYEYITLRDLLLDGNYTCGGVLLLNALRTTIDNCYVTHFSGTSAGISVQGGHETMIRGCFVGQHITEGGDPDERNFNGTGIILAGNDNVLTDIVIFSGAIGVDVDGQANILTGVHCYNKATGWGGVGVLARSGGAAGGGSQLRMVGCYIDYTVVVLEEPRQVSISDSFFLGDAFVLLRAMGGANSSVVGVSIAGNMFLGSGNGIPIVQLQGSFQSILQTVVDLNSVSGMALRATRARSAMAALASNWTLDFSQTLLFPDLITHVQYSFFAHNSSAAGFFPDHALLAVAANRVTIASDRQLLATVAVSVDQSLDSDLDSRLYN